MPRYLKVTAIAYLAALGIVVAFGAYRFQHLYAPLLPPEAAQRGVAYARYLRLTQPVLGVAPFPWTVVLACHL
jgi:hypothetical protein